MKLKIIFILLIFTVLIFAGCSKLEPQDTEISPIQLPPQTQQELPQELNDVPRIITIKNSVFVPDTLRIKQGETITFLNEDTTKHRPASNVHPTHTVYPGSDIKKCDSNEQIFDACKGLEQGESFSFIFNEKGTWNYHDHLNPRLKGTIIAE